MDGRPTIGSAGEKRRAAPRGDFSAAERDSSGQRGQKAARTQQVGRDDPFTERLRGILANNGGIKNQDKAIWLTYCCLGYCMLSLIRTRRGASFTGHANTDSITDPAKSYIAATADEGQTLLMYRDLESHALTFLPACCLRSTVVMNTYRVRRAPVSPGEQVPMLIGLMGDARTMVYRIMLVKVISLSNAAYLAGIARSRALKA